MSPPPPAKPLRYSGAAVGSRSPPLAQKPHAIVCCPSSKGNMQFQGRTGVSPKGQTAAAAFHKFRSPSYTEQNGLILGKGKQTTKKNSGRGQPKN